MNDKSCENCLTYRAGECLGRGLCDYYRPAPSKGAEEYWPRTMRSRGSYPGSGSSGLINIYNSSTKNTEYVSKKSATNGTRTDLKKQVDFCKINLNSIASINEIPYPLHGKVIAWISFEKLELPSGIKYRSKCLLQYNNYVLRVDEANPESREQRSILRGIYIIANHINKPNNIHIITDRDVLSDISADSSFIDEDLVRNIVKAYKEKGCTITELVLEDGKELILNQINDPILEI